MPPPLALYCSYLGAATNAPVVCALDCPRTTLAYDDGNPRSAWSVTQQQLDRAVTFLFRRKSNFSIYLRTEIGR